MEGTIAFSFCNICSCKLHWFEFVVHSVVWNIIKFVHFYCSHRLHGPFWSLKYHKICAFLQCQFYFLRYCDCCLFVFIVIRFCCIVLKMIQLWLRAQKLTGQFYLRIVPNTFRCLVPLTRTRKVIWQVKMFIMHNFGLQCVSDNFECSDIMLTASLCWFCCLYFIVN